MTDSPKQHVKVFQFLSSFLILFISIAALLTEASPIHAIAAEDLSTGTWSGSGKITSLGNLGNDPQSTPKAFTMSLTIKTVDPAKKTWSGTLSEDLVNYTGVANVNGSYTSTQNGNFNFTSDHGFNYTGTIKNGTSIKGTWAST